MCLKDLIIWNMESCLGENCPGSEDCSKGGTSGSGTLEERYRGRKRRWLLMEEFFLELPRVGKLLTD